MVPARDEAERIAACLHALAAQRASRTSDYEVIVVLDGCRDDTRAARARSSPRAEPSLRLHVVVHRRARGVGRARRRGMDLACERLLARRQPATG